MKSNRMTLTKLRRLIKKCLDEGVTLAFCEPNIPNMPPPPPLSEEVKEASLMAYSSALNDVLEAIDGNPGALKDAASEEGRLALRPWNPSYLEEGTIMRDDEAP